VSLNAFGDGKI